MRNLKTALPGIVSLGLIGISFPIGRLSFPGFNHVGAAIFLLGVAVAILGIEGVNPFEFLFHKTR